MRVEVFLSPEEKDVWSEVANAVVVDNYLHVLKHIVEDEIPDWMRTYEITKLVTRPAMNPQTKTTTYRLLATYAPGMWMKVEYSSG